MASAREEYLRALQLPETTLRQQIHKSTVLRRIGGLLTPLEELASIFERHPPPPLRPDDLPSDLKDRGNHDRAAI